MVHARPVVVEAALGVDALAGVAEGAGDGSAGAFAVGQIVLLGERSGAGVERRQHRALNIGDHGRAGPADGDLAQDIVRAGSVSVPAHNMTLPPQRWPAHSFF